jgi:hypothetical protein
MAVRTSRRYRQGYFGKSVFTTRSDTVGRPGGLMRRVIGNDVFNVFPNSYKNTLKPDNSRALQLMDTPELTDKR